MDFTIEVICIRGKLIQIFQDHFVDKAPVGTFLLPLIFLKYFLFPRDFKNRENEAVHCMQGKKRVKDCKKFKRLLLWLIIAFISMMFLTLTTIFTGT